MKVFLLLSILVLFSQKIFSQSTSDYAVQLTASVQSNPPGITLNWPLVNANSYLVYRKLKTDNFWGAVYATLPGASTQFIDSTVLPGISYEYKFSRIAASFSGFGYINTGIEIPENNFRGKLILIIDDSFSVSLSQELFILKGDLENEGWQVMPFLVSRTLSVDSVKSIIVNQYLADPVNVKSVFLFGHIPVPYSGLIAPDGHSNHIGAWPADVYYADINGNWTDITANDSSASDPRNRNVPGDGKFDQSYLPSDVELQIGRVDFSNLPVFTSNEEALLRNYLNKNHDYRCKVFTPLNRAVIDDNFGAFGGEAFAASGFKNFAPLLGDTNIISDDYRTMLDSGSYIWSYGCGGGSYTTCGGVGASSDFAGDSLQTIFTMLFGSYFGDWDVSDNFMRSALASGTTLTICWSGRPHWMFHHMGLGENIGFDARLSQNNSSIYFGNSSTRSIHLALLGDPSLTMYVISPPLNLTADIMSQNIAQLTWTASADSVLGYNIYRRTDSLSSFVKINSQTVFGTSFYDSCLVDTGIYQYMVRAIKLEITPSGSFYNLSPGTSDTANVYQDLNVVASFNYTNVNDSLIISANNCVNASSYLWTFGDGGTSVDSLPVYVYAAGGNYTVTLNAYSACDADSVSQTINIITAVFDRSLNKDLRIYPNPAKDHIYFYSKSRRNYVSLYSSDMKCILENHLFDEGVQELNLSGLDQGIYFLIINEMGGRIVKMVVKE